jgi:hypothetical protein
MRGVLGPLNSGMLTNNVCERHMRTSGTHLMVSYGVFS